MQFLKKPKNKGTQGNKKFEEVALSNINSLMSLPKREK